MLTQRPGSHRDQDDQHADPSRATSQVVRTRDSVRGCRSPAFGGHVSCAQKQKGQASGLDPGGGRAGLGPLRPLHTIETDAAAGRVRNKGCFPESPPGLSRRASRGSAGTRRRPHSEHFLAKLRGGERSHPWGPRVVQGTGLCLADL